MGKIWINPAFKDKVQLKEEPEKEVKLKKEPEKKAETPKPKKAKKKQKEKTPDLYASPNYGLELKFLKHLQDSQAVIEVKIIGGPTFTGKIKWIFLWMMALELEDNKVVGFSRLNFSHYSIKQSDSIPEEDITKLPVPEIPKSDNIFQQYKNDKTPLIFHLRDGFSIKGTIEWHEKILFHIKSIDEKKEYNITRDAILYFEEATGDE